MAFDHLRKRRFRLTRQRFAPILGGRKTRQSFTACPPTPSRPASCPKQALEGWLDAALISLERADFRPAGRSAVGKAREIVVLTYLTQQGKRDILVSP